MFLKVFIVSVVFSVTTFAVNKDLVKSASTNYLKIGNEIMTSVKDGSASEASISEKIDGMVKEAHVVMKEYASKYKEADKLIKYLIGETGKLKKLNFAALESDYHDAKKLSKDIVGIDLKDESNEKFLDPCHILIHPLMVLAGVREKKHKDALEELNEGMEQMKTSEKELSK